MSAGEGSTLRALMASAPDRAPIQPIARPPRRYPSADQQADQTRKHPARAPSPDPEPSPPAAADHAVWSGHPTLTRYPTVGRRALRVPRPAAPRRSRSRPRSRPHPAANSDPETAPPRRPSYAVIRGDCLPVVYKVYTPTIAGTLDALRARTGSDAASAQVLEMTRQQIHLARRRRVLTDRAIIAAARALDAPPGYLLAALHADMSSDPSTAATWLSAAAALAPSGFDASCLYYVNRCRRSCLACLCRCGGAGQAQTQQQRGHRATKTVHDRVPDRARARDRQVSARVDKLAGRRRGALFDGPCTADTRRQRRDF